jgi:hypothetical protein
MIIKTKYKIGDMHWDLEGRMAKSYRCFEIRIDVRDCGDAPPSFKITYVVYGSKLISEDDFTPTKEALLKSL